MKQTVLLLLLLCASMAWPQGATTVTNGKATSTASCSPAFVGRDATFNIHCEGVPKEEVEKMTRLLNGILSKQLDPDKVYSQLNSISRNVNNLGASLDPVNHAPPAVAALLKTSQQMVASCSDFLSKWDEKMATRLQDAVRQQQDATEKRRADIEQHRFQRQTPQIPGYQPELDKVAQKYSAEYQATLAAKVKTMRVTLQEALAKNPPTKSQLYLPARKPANYDTVNKIEDLQAVQNDLHKLTGEYSVWVLHGRTDPVTKESQDLQFACINIVRHWSEDSRKIRTDYVKDHPIMPAAKPTQQTMPRFSGMAVQDENNKERAAEYRKSLAPQLSSWRDQIAKQLPGVSAVPDYFNVSTNLQLGSVCKDVSNLNTQYYAKVRSDLQKK